MILTVLFSCSCVICMKMIQSLISLNAVWVEMVQGQPQAHTGGYDNTSLCYVRTGSWKVNEMNVYMFVVVNSNLFRVFGTTPGSEEASTLEASRSPNRYRIHICWLISIHFDGRNFYYLTQILADNLSRRPVQNMSPSSGRSLPSFTRRGIRRGLSNVL